MKLNNKNILIFALQLLLGSGSVKLYDTNAFSEALVNFNLFSGDIIKVLEYAIPLLELLLGLFLIFNFSSSLPSLLATFILSLFTAIIVAKLFEGEKISCGCFGNHSSDKLDIYSVIRNIILIAISILISIYYESFKVHEGKKNLDTKIIRLILLINLVFYLASQNMIFALQNRGLKGRLSLLLENENILQRGERVKDFNLFSLSKEKIAIHYPQNLSKKTLLFLLKPTCEPCKLNLHNWENIYTQIDTVNVRVLGVSIDKFEATLTYVSTHKLPYGVYYLDDNNDFLIDYKPYLTPQTILIDKKAKVIKVWKGILDNNSINEIINLINNEEE